MIQPEQVQQSSLQIIYMHGISYWGPTKFIRLTVNVPALRSASSHKDRERIRMMISSGRSLLAFLVLTKRRSAEFARTYDERLVK